MTAALKILSSMATREVLAELAAQYRQETGQPVDAEAAGGVDVARRIEAGEAVDAVVLAASAIDQLIAKGCVVTGSRVDLAGSGIAVAVRAGAVRPAISSEDDVRQAVLAASSLCYSTGPSGVYLEALFERWGIAADIRARIVQAPPGVPVGSLVACGEAALGFQQLSELMHLDGIDVLGPLPPAIQRVTTFSAGVAAASARPDAVRAMLEFLRSPAAEAAKRRHGMMPA